MVCLSKTKAFSIAFFSISVYPIAVVLLSKENFLSAYRCIFSIIVYLLTLFVVYLAAYNRFGEATTETEILKMLIGSIFIASIANVANIGVFLLGIRSKINQAASEGAPNTVDTIKNILFLMGLQLLAIVMVYGNLSQYFVSKEASSLVESVPIFFANQPQKAAVLFLVIVSNFMFQIYDYQKLLLRRSE